MICLQRRRGKESGSSRRGLRLKGIRKTHMAGSNVITVVGFALTIATATAGVTYWVEHEKADKTVVAGSIQDTRAEIYDARIETRMKQLRWIQEKKRRGEATNWDLDLELELRQEIDMLREQLESYEEQLNHQRHRLDQKKSQFRRLFGDDAYDDLKEILKEQGDHFGSSQTPSFS